MAYLPIKNYAEFEKNIRQIEATDLAKPETFNPQYETLINNDVILDKKAFEAENALNDINVNLETIESTIALQSTNIADTKELVENKIVELDETFVSLQGGLFNDIHGFIPSRTKWDGSGGLITVSSLGTKVMSWEDGAAKTVFTKNDGSTVTKVTKWENNEIETEVF